MKHFITENLADRMEMLDLASKDEESLEVSVEQTATPTDDIPF